MSAIWSRVVNDTNPTLDPVSVLHDVHSGVFVVAKESHDRSSPMRLISMTEDGLRRWDRPVNAEFTPIAADSNPGDGYVLVVGVQSMLRGGGWDSSIALLKFPTDGNFSRIDPN